MSNVFVISDTHFNHKNVILFSSRPFQTVEEMNEAMVENWNRVVKSNDIVYHLGDVYFGKAEKAEPYIARLNGRKKLILGNHDDVKCSVLNKHFEKMKMWSQKFEYGLVLTHTPLHSDSWELTGDEHINVHGHIHEKKIRGDRHINVCVEHINYTPIAIEEIAKRN